MSSRSKPNLSQMKCHCRWEDWSQTQCYSSNGRWLQSKWQRSRIWIKCYIQNSISTFHFSTCMKYTWDKSNDEKWPSRGTMARSEVCNPARGHSISINQFSVIYPSYQSSSIAINQCANFVVNDKENLFLLAKMLKISTSDCLRIGPRASSL